MTGLPMVFAVWAGRKGAVTPEVAEAFRESCRYGRERIEEIVASESRGRGFPAGAGAGIPDAAHRARAGAARIRRDGAVSALCQAVWNRAVSAVGRRLTGGEPLPYTEENDNVVYS